MVRYSAYLTITIVIPGTTCLLISRHGQDFASVDPDHAQFPGVHVNYFELPRPAYPPVEIVLERSKTVAHQEAVTYPFLLPYNRACRPGPPILEPPAVASLPSSQPHTNQSVCMWELYCKLSMQNLPGLLCCEVVGLGKEKSQHLSLG